MRKRAVQLMMVAVSVTLLAGCGSIRQSTQQATLGAFDALRDPSDPLVAEIRALVHKYVAIALKAGPPEPIEEVAGKITAGVLEAVEARAPATVETARGLVRAMVHDALAEAVTTLRGELRRMPSAAGVASAAAEQAGAAFARGASAGFLEQMERQIGPDGRGPLAQSLAGLMARTTTAGMQAVSDQVMASAPDCTSSDPAVCPPSLVRRVTRAAAIGITEGVERKTDPWPYVLAFAGGFVIAALGAWAKHAIEGRPPRVGLR